MPRSVLRRDTVAFDWVALRATAPEARNPKSPRATVRSIRPKMRVRYLVVCNCFTSMCSYVTEALPVFCADADVCADLGLADQVVGGTEGGACPLGRDVRGTGVLSLRLAVASPAGAGCQTAFPPLDRTRVERLDDEPLDAHAFTAGGTFGGKRGRRAPGARLQAVVRDPLRGDASPAQRLEDGLSHGTELRVAVERLPDQRCVVRRKRCRARSRRRRRVGVGHDRLPGREDLDPVARR